MASSHYDPIRDSAQTQGDTERRNSANRPSRLVEAYRQKAKQVDLQVRSILLQAFGADFVRARS